MIATPLADPLDDGAPMREHEPLTETEVRDNSRGFRDHAVFVGIIALVVNLGVAVHVSSILRTLLWPRVWGTVLSSDVSTQGSRWWAPDIGYTYSVDDVAYEGTEYSTDSIKWGKNRAENVAAKYQAGEPIIVSYDPQSPFRAVLVRGYGDGARNLSLALGIGVIVSAFAVAAWRTVWLRSRGQLLWVRFDRNETGSSDGWGNGCDGGDGD